MPDTLLRESDAIWMCRYTCIAKISLSHTHGFTYTLDSWTGNKLRCWVWKHMLQMPIYCSQKHRKHRKQWSIQTNYEATTSHRLDSSSHLRSGILLWPTIIVSGKKMSASFEWYKVDVCRSPKVDVHSSELDFYLPTQELELPLLQIQ
jgi:hypothetical protein